MSIGKEEEKTDDFVKVETPASKQREAEKQKTTSTAPSTTAPGRSVPTMPNEKTPSATAKTQAGFGAAPTIPPRPSPATTTTATTTTAALPAERAGAASSPAPRPNATEGKSEMGTGVSTDGEREEIQRAAYKACKPSFPASACGLDADVY